MKQSTGTGIIVFGIVLAAIGAVMKYAITVSTTGFSITEVGLILLIVGIVVVVLGGLVSLTSGRHHIVTTEQIQHTPEGSTRSVESKDVFN